MRLEENHIVQRIFFYNLIKEKPLTMKEAAVKMGIDRGNICWYWGMLRKSGRAFIHKRRKCSITGRIVLAITTNPDLGFMSNQLRLFDYD